jgi:hypothetical protein
MTMTNHKLRFFTLSTVALILGAACLLTPNVTAASQEPPVAAYDHGAAGWDAPPGEFRDIQRQGFHMGIEGARKDFDHHKAPDVESHGEYRHPPVSRSARDDYREGYRRGYEAAMNHLNAGESAGRY